MSPVEDGSAYAVVDGLFRRESAHLVAALTRLLGPSHLALAEDVVHDALIGAMQAWRFGLPDDPKAWILRVAKNRAIDCLRRERRLEALDDTHLAGRSLEGAVELALSSEADAANQLAMMFAICDDALSPETHVTLILRFLCGLSPSEIARAFLVDVGTIDRRLHRGRTRLEQLGALHDASADEVRARQPSVEQALYLLFNEGYLGSDPENPLQPAMCADALRLVEVLLASNPLEHARVNALAALFCFDAARLPGRLDDTGVLTPLAEQDRAKWSRVLVDRGIVHLGESASGDLLTRWHLEAGIAFEHTRAQSFEETNWGKIVDYYDALLALTPGPVVALNRALALAELRGVDAGRAALALLDGHPKLTTYSFYWAALADLARRGGLLAEAKNMYARASALAKSRAERVSYERRILRLGE